MQTYVAVSADKQPEKFFGGLLTLGQGGWIAAGAMGGMLFSGAVYMAIKNMWVAIPFAIPFLIGGGIMAFVRIHGMSIIKYHSTKAIFNKQQQYIINCRPKYLHEVKDYTGNSVSDIYDITGQEDYDSKNFYTIYKKKSDLIEKEKKLGLYEEKKGKKKVK